MSLNRARVAFGIAVGASASGRRLISAFALALLLGSCVPSLSPLYTEKDLVVEPALVGTWVDPEDPDESWTFEAREGKSYRLVIRGTESGKETSGVFDAHIVALRGRRFLDLFPAAESLEPTALAAIYKATLVPAHLFLRVDEIGAGFRFAAMDPDALGKLLKRKPRTIEHRTVGEGGFVLTAPTRALQRFVLAFAHSKDVFGSPTRLERRAATP